MQPSMAVLAALALGACAQTSQNPATVTAPVVTGTVTSASVPAVAASQPTATAPEAPAASAPDEGTPAAGPTTLFRTCQVDTDCVAVDRVGCCHNGYKEAVAVSEKDAYAHSFTCPQAHPVCPMFIMRDMRVAQCDTAAHRCAMVRAEEIACGGSGTTQHHCPSGYQCQAPKTPSATGQCVATP